MLYRQGDVLIESVVDIPSDATTVKPVDGRIILAHGEATGHHHSISATDVDLAAIDADGNMFLRLCRDSALIHQEHAPINLSPGNYRVTRQREYSPEAIRNVAD